MKNIKIKVSSSPFSENDILRKELLMKFPNVQFKNKKGRFSSAELVEFFKDTDAAIVGLDPFDKATIDLLPKLKVIAKYGVGLDNIDVDYAQKKGILIGWTGGINRRSVAELTMAFILGSIRSVFAASRNLSRGEWSRQQGYLLTGKTIGIVGCGYIGTDLLMLLKPYNCRILINDIVDKKEIAEVYGAENVSFDKLIEVSDVITLHVPLTEKTNGLINYTEFVKMKKSAILINTSRGEVVNNFALKKALIEKEITGAALDVFFPEPPEDLEFLAMPNLTGTPHIGGNAQEAILAMGREAISNLEKKIKLLQK